MQVPIASDERMFYDKRHKSCSFHNTIGIGAYLPSVQR
jgi:hypothetical protein